MGDHTGKQPLELSTMSSPRRYSRGSRADHNLRARKVREANSYCIRFDNDLSTSGDCVLGEVCLWRNRYPAQRAWLPCGHGRSSVGGATSPSDAGIARSG